MILARAPMRISFVGGGTDFPDFYRRYPGQVISTAIDKFVHIAINRTPLVDKISARYNTTETVDCLDDLKHTRIKAALADAGIATGLEIASFATLPVNTGLGSSSSFSVALIRALTAYQGKKIDKTSLAEAASRLEIDLVGEPIGKQDQYAAAFGGFNRFRFETDGTVQARPVLLDFKSRSAFEDRVMLFFTGITRNASSVLAEQKANIEKKFETLQSMADAVPEFASRLTAADYPGMGRMLHEGWIQKKSLSSNGSNSAIDAIYEAGLGAGAWGGKLLGAGGGGCVLFLAPPEHKADIRSAVSSAAAAQSLTGFREIPIQFIQSGAELLHNSDFNGRGVAFA